MAFSFENGLYYWNSPATGKGRLEKDFGKNFPEIKNGSILDLGCSTGEVTNEIAKKYPDCRVIGIDRSEERVEIARRNFPNCEFLAADAYFPPFNPESFEGVFSMNNLWFLICKEFCVKTHGVLSSVQSEKSGFNSEIKNTDFSESKKRIGIPKEVILRILDLVKEKGYLFFSGSNKGAIFKKDNPVKLIYYTSPELIDYTPQIPFLLETFNSNQDYQGLERKCA